MQQLPVYQSVKPLVMQSNKYRRKCRRRCRSLQSINQSIMTTLFWLSSLIVCALANHSVSPSIEQSIDSPTKPTISDCYGVFELKGRRHYMEDCHAVYSSMHWHISQVATHSPFINEHPINQTINPSPWISFAVYDGHGGHSASSFSAVRLLPKLHADIEACETMALALPSPEQSIKQSIDQAIGADPVSSDPSVNFDQTTSLAINQSLDTAKSFDQSNKSINDIFTKSFLWLDEAYKSHPLSQHRSDNPHGDGSTALVASINLNDGRIIVANAGDCRALLIRNRRSIDQSIEPHSACSTDSYDSSTPSDIESELESDSSDEETSQPVSQPKCQPVPSSQLAHAEDDSDAESDSEDDLDGDIEDEKTFAQGEAEIAAMYSHFYPEADELIDPTMKRWLNAANSRFTSASSKRALQPPAKIPPPLMKGDYEPLSLDAKPHLPGEHSYITSLPHGFVNRASPLSVSRVQGVLATSRAIGDYELKPWVRSEPHIVTYQMHNHSHEMYVDRWLLLASDGFFDVFTNAAVSRAIRAMQAQGLTPHQMARQLTVAAYKKGSFDNITVMIIDLACLQEAYAQQGGNAEQNCLSESSPHPHTESF